MADITDTPNQPHEPGRTATEAEDGRQTVDPNKPEEARQPTQSEGDADLKEDFARGGASH
jgi:hypothetical protein